MKTVAYDKKFYTRQSEDSYLSAKSLLPAVLDIFQPNSLIDFGAGVGTFLQAAKELGINDVLGVEGDWVRGQHPPEIPFLYQDLNYPVDIGRKFDLAISLEVGEHLQTSNSQQFITSICNASDVVLFGAALPGQGGRNHINEQPAQFWWDLFSAEGFLPKDVIRAKVWNEPGIVNHYRQNTYLFVKGTHPLAQQINHVPLLDVVHPTRFLRVALKSRVDNGMVAMSNVRLLKLAIRFVWRRATGRIKEPA